MKKNDAHPQLSALIVPPAGTNSSKFWEGFSVPLLGLKVLRLRPHLWKYSLFPILLNLVITAAVILTLLAVSGAFIYLAYPWFTSGWSGGWEYLAIGAGVFFAIVLLIFCVGIAVLTWRMLTGVLCGYFYGRLAAQVERDFGLPPEAMHEITFRYEVIDTSRDIGWLLVALALSLIFSLVPLIGPPVALLYSMYFQVLVCGRDQFAYPMALRGQRRSERVEFTKRHRFHTLGVGLAVFLLQFIPILGAILMVTATAGTVVLHRRILLTEQSVKPSHHKK